MSIEPDDHVQELRAAVLRLRAPKVSQRAPAPRSSVYGRAAAAVPGDVRPPATRAVLEARFRNVETSALLVSTTMVLVVLPDKGQVPAGLMRSLELLATAQATVLVLGPGTPRQIDPGKVMTLPLRPDDALSEEWAVLALSPQTRGAFLARRDGDKWRWMLTADPIAVQRAGTAILERAPFLGLRVPALSED